MIVLSAKTAANSAMQLKARSLTRFSIACLLAISAFGLWASPTSAAAPYLRVSPVYLGDASWCGEVLLTIIDIQDQPVNDCRERSGNKKYQLKIWAFSVTNTHRTKTAINVKARIQLKTVGGIAEVDRVINVAGTIPPGQTVWVAPAYYPPTDSCVWPGRADLLASNETGVTAVSGEASIVSSQLASMKKTKLRENTLFSQSKQIRQQSNDILNYFGLHHEVVIQNPSASFRAHITHVFRTTNGEPIGGYRVSDCVVIKGRSGIDTQFLLPRTTIDKVTSVTLQIVRSRR